MQEEKRRILTKDSVRRQQMHYMKGDLILGLPALLIVEAMLIAVTCGAYHSSPHMWLLWGLFILLDVLVFAVFAWMFILPNVRVWRYIVPGNFSIVEDTLVGVGEDEVIRRRRRGYRTIDMLYFEGHGHIPEDKGTRGYGPVGSMFYLVILNDGKQTLHTFYSSQLYYHDPKGA